MSPQIRAHGSPARKSCEGSPASSTGGAASSGLAHHTCQWFAIVHEIHEQSSSSIATPSQAMGLPGLRLNRDSLGLGQWRWPKAMTCIFALYLWSL
jgi:hypothetical protein